MAKALKLAIVYRKMAFDAVAELHDRAKALDFEDLPGKTLFDVRYARLDKDISDFNARQEEILTILVSADKDVDPTLVMQKEFDAMVDDVRVVHKELFPVATVAPSSPSSAVSAIPSLSTHALTTRNVQLPKIQLPHFSGNFKQWPTFIELYTSLIHTHPFLSDIEKFQYLQSALSDGPLHLLHNFPLSAANYPLAYKALVAEYDCPRKMMTYYWDEIVNCGVHSKPSLRTLLNTYDQNLAMMKTLNYTVDKLSDFIITNSLLAKIQPSLKQRFERTATDPTAMPTFNKLKEFLELECRSMEISSSSDQPVKQRQVKNTSLLVNTDTVPICKHCKDSAHKISLCPTFLQLTPKNRFKRVKELRMCIRCLESHSNTCPEVCKVCQGTHNALLHFPSTQLKADQQSRKVACMSNQITPTYPVLLATVQALLQDEEGNFRPVRAVLDSGSQVNFISEDCVKRFNLPCHRSSFIISGIGDVPTQRGKGSVSCIMRPRLSNAECLTFEAVVLPKICGAMLPDAPVNLTSWEDYQQLELADPGFNVPSKIDMLIGADLFPTLLRPGLRPGEAHALSAFNTMFGWVLMGHYTIARPSHRVHALVAISMSSLETVLKQFWEVEDVAGSPAIACSPEDQFCEDLFTRTVCRNFAGRYEVTLPFREKNPMFTNSFQIAYRRFLMLEKRLGGDASLYRAYASFMEDYLTSGHMSLASTSPAAPSMDAGSATGEYYIPHHGIFNMAALKPKLRVVFDASAKDVAGRSLNSVMFAGPKLQLDISILLLQFRTHAVAFCSDIRQMYRQILVTPEHRRYQKILWRESPTQPLSQFCLNTVTYGVNSSPFLALRVIAQLAVDGREAYPWASRVLQNSIYVDDILTGASTVADAVMLRDQLIELFASAGMELRKWSSNHPEILQNISADHCEVPLPMDKDSTVKVLGLHWSPAMDVFSFTVKITDRPVTKRNILSDLARIFDPLGFLAPVSFFAKFFMQWLWCLGIDWDALPPEPVVAKWLAFKAELPTLVNVSIPRYVPKGQECEMHGFCDASEKGYGAVVYLRVRVSAHTVKLFLVAAKSKVAPLKKISVPRLELCAAYLLSRVIKFVRSSIDSAGLFPVFAWSDSTVTLAWITSPPHRWKTFVCNRVAYIQEIVPPNSWRHVGSHDNPADCASRGLFPSQLLEHSLWWNGPLWLQRSSTHWPRGTLEDTSLHSEEERKVNLLVINEDNDVINTLIIRLSSFRTLVHVVAYVNRFRHNCQEPSRNTGPISRHEWQEAMITLVRRVQALALPNEVRRIKVGGALPKWLEKLHPFLDDNDCVRVGGRIAGAVLSKDRKFPLLLPDHRFTRLLIEFTHVKYLHIGNNTLHHILAQQFWIISPKRIIKSVRSKCVACFRANPTRCPPFMGNLPPDRIIPVKPFTNAGVDFAGPFSCKSSTLRNAKVLKCYVCLFVCLATKAVHLELASNLSTDAFLGALRRFVSRRGTCMKLTSDCGTNFVGAHRALLRCMHDAASGETIQWVFNPPGAPHFGGIWEAGIKSVKSHLARVIGLQLLTFEELYTVLVQIEAILNSRPLTALSSDPCDLTTLTPGHFLTLAPLTTVPESSRDNANNELNLLRRWRLVQRMQQDFWNRWKLEYLHTLQQRQKWLRPAPELSIGTLVVIRGAQTSPLHWECGRIVQVFPGEDGVGRVASVQTIKGIIKRPMLKLCPLPIY